ncbi:neprilysin-3-like [Ixodes scapularis]
MIFVEGSKIRRMKSSLTTIFVAAATVVFFVTAATSHFESGVSAVLNSSHQFGNVTETAHVHWLFRQSMDPTKHPCQNFYGYVCGRYHLTQVEPLFELVAQNVSSRIRDEFFKLKPTSKNYSANGKAVAFFSSCLSRVEEAQKDKNRNALASFMENNRLTFDTKNARNKGLLYELFYFLFDYNLTILFELSVDAWPQREGSVRFIYIVASNDFENWSKIRAISIQERKYDELVKRVVAAMGVPDDSIEHLCLKIVRVEEMIMKIWKNRMAYSDSNSSPLTDKWESTLRLHSRAAFKDGYSLDLKSDVPAFLDAVLTKLLPTEHSLYLTWLITRHLASVSGLVTADSVKQNKKFCFRKTYALFKNAVIAPYLLQAVDQTTISEVRRMIELIAQEVQVSIKYSDWSEPDMRSKLQKKIAAVKWKLGFAAGLSSWNGINRYYSRYPVPRGSFLDAYLATSRAYAKQQLKLRPYRSSHFANADLESDKPSVSYGGPNTISIAAAAMVSTFFDVREQPALNFGVLGSIVTRQLMRAFHHENRRYDEQGYRFRWNESEEIKFMDRWNCRQNLRPGLPYDDAEPTVSIGAHALFRAYKKAAAGRFDVASGGLNSDQLFFVSRCYVYCGYRHIDTPHECAVLAQDSPEFARAFNCPKGSPMNPENKCDLW